MESQIASRSNRMNNIRASLQLNPVMKKNTIAIENKLEKRKKRKQSLNITEEMSESQNLFSEEDDSAVKTISKFTQKYELAEKIGEGSNGLVRKCYLKQNNQLYAVKSMVMDDEHIIFLKKNFKQIRALNHQNIIRYQTMFLDLKKHSCHLVMDYEALPNLLSIPDLSETEIKKIMFQLLGTLEYIHSSGICHRDIKPQNILYDRQNQSIKIIDFGISKKIKERGNKKQMLTITGTLFYRAPQMFLGGGYDEKVDIWAAGITLFYLITKKTPFESEYHSETIKNIQKSEIQFGPQWKKYNKFAKDLVGRLIRKRSERLTARQALQHLWFQDLHNGVDLTKSDNLNFKFASTFNEKKVVEEEETIDFRFQRSLTNQKQKLSLDSLPNNENSEKVKINSLKKWLSGSDEEDCLIQIQSEGQLQKQSPYIAQRKKI